MYVSRLELQSYNFSGQYELKVEARDGIGAGPFTDEADILIDIHRINNYRPEFIMPASSNATIEVQDVSIQIMHLYSTHLLIWNNLFFCVRTWQLKIIL